MPARPLHGVDGQSAGSPRTSKERWSFDAHWAGRAARPWAEGPQEPAVVGPAQLARCREPPEPGLDRPCQRRSSRAYRFRRARTTATRPPGVARGAFPLREKAQQQDVIGGDRVNFAGRDEREAVGQSARSRPRPAARPREVLRTASRSSFRGPRRPRRPRGRAGAHRAAALHRRRVPATKVSGEKATRSRRSAVSVVAPHSRSTRPRDLLDPVGGRHAPVLDAQGLAPIARGDLLDDRLADVDRVAVGLCRRGPRTRRARRPRGSRSEPRRLP